jgi:antitoxin VapB
MALNIKDPETERLAAEVAKLTGESKTRAVRVALQERKKRLELERPKGARRPLLQFFEEEIWPHIPADQLGKPISKEEREEILGLGPDGV